MLKVGAGSRKQGRGKMEQGSEIREKGKGGEGNREEGG